jgi:Sugar-specific transcriptional regulator TrmB
VRGRTVAELKLAIAGAISAADGGGQAPPQPDLPARRPHEQAVLEAVQAAAGPLTARCVSDASGVPTGTIADALAVLRARGLVTRRRDGRTWRYAAAMAGQCAGGQLERPVDVPSA